MGDFLEVGTLKGKVINLPQMQTPLEHHFAEQSTSHKAGLRADLRRCGDGDGSDFRPCKHRLLDGEESGVWVEPNSAEEGDSCEGAAPAQLERSGNEDPAERGRIGAGAKATDQMPAEIVSQERSCEAERTHVLRNATTQKQPLKVEPEMMLIDPGMFKARIDELANANESMMRRCESGTNVTSERKGQFAKQY